MDNEQIDNNKCTTIFADFQEQVNRELEIIDKLNGFHFENYCAYLLKLNGYQKINVTKKSGDGGCDILAERDCVKFAIQCKRASGKLGIEPIQEVVAAKNFYGCHVAIILTNSSLLNHAIQYAKNNQVILWDRMCLSAFITRAVLCAGHSLYDRIIDGDELECLQKDTDDSSLGDKKPKRKTQITRDIMIDVLKGGPMLRTDFQKITFELGATTGTFQRNIDQLKRENVIIATDVYHGKRRVTTYCLSDNYEQILGTTSANFNKAHSSKIFNK